MKHIVMEYTAAQSKYLTVVGRITKVASGKALYLSDFYMILSNLIAYLSWQQISDLKEQNRWLLASKCSRKSVTKKHLSIQSSIQPTLCIKHLGAEHSIKVTTIREFSLSR